MFSIRFSRDAANVPSRTIHLVRLRAGDRALEDWRRSDRFNAAERAALALTEAVTALGDRTGPVPDEIWHEAARHYDGRALAALVVEIARIVHGASPQAVELAA